VQIKKMSMNYPNLGYLYTSGYAGNICMGLYRPQVKLSVIVSVYPVSDETLGAKKSMCLPACMKNLGN
jgi:hypothetical protein